MLHGRLGLEKAQIPHKNRHGLLWLDRGQLSVENGCLRFITGGGALGPGDYQIPHQSVSTILLGPGSSVSQDALRLLARHNTLLCAVGEDGVRAYTAPPLGPDRSDLARRQARVWADETMRLDIARRLYAWRLGEVLPHKDIAILRGIEGARMKTSYKLAAERYGITWRGRRYDRSNPNAADLPNQAINHAASAVEAAAVIAVTACGAIPQLGFIHEDAGQAFVLDIADLFRVDTLLPIAFGAVKEAQKNPTQSIERLTRRRAAREMKRLDTVSNMIGKIKDLFGYGETEG
ncbi:CRISPR-associated endonuclease Cas1 [Iodidimonas gelatinilytica]|uniref:CRISPR-associated endonuclease Cas1 n=1 Tax=Iodidimonas gelatinilytica TaxID=1236966 RepID=A0A5A7MXL3_9PROT|nr:type I-E CRISPR-associated endonuclease Cas1e [Iodidimonas gelatinilytica]GER00607.1 CRISPR-associated endonuclease Cas1 [Iodidimonas gelatinilytica]